MQCSAYSILLSYNTRIYASCKRLIYLARRKLESRAGAKSGRKENSFFACNAALQLGLIYEEQGFKKDAIYYFRECKNIDPDVYQGQLHKKADTGLERLKKK